MTDWRNFTDEADILDLIPDQITYDLKKGKKVTVPLKDEGRVITRNLPVEVPLRYCADKKYDGAKEALLCMGHGCKIGSYTFNAPVMGVYTMMEITNNPFPVNFGKCTVIQQFHVLLFNELREAALPLVIDWHQQDKEFDPEDKDTWTLLDHTAVDFIDKLSTNGVDLTSPETWSDIIDMFWHSGNGFEMIPGGGSSKFWYGSETMGSIIAGLGADMNKTFDELMWQTPLALIGFTYVGKARQNGVKGVKRPKDREDVRRHMILAYLRELHGELHPWQIDRPLDHRLTDLQEKHASCVKLFETMKKGAKKNG